MRALGYINMMPHTSKGKTLSPQELYPFHWDKKPVKAKRLTPTEIEYIDAKRKLQKNGLIK